MRRLEPVLLVAVDGRLPEELHESGKVHSVFAERLEQFVVDEFGDHLELVLVEHGVIHVVVTVKFNELRLANHAFIDHSGSHLLHTFVDLLLHCVLIKEESEEAGVLLEDKSDTVPLSVFFHSLEVDEGIRSLGDSGAAAPLNDHRTIVLDDSDTVAAARENVP